MKKILVILLLMFMQNTNAVDIEINQFLINEEVAKKHIPLIESTLLGVLSTTTADELSTSAGKETIRLTALDKVQAAMEAVEGSKVIERVLFTGFVMQ